MFKMIAYAFYAAAFADFALYAFADMDLTGVSWSPLALAVLGDVVRPADPDSK